MSLSHDTTSDLPMAIRTTFNKRYKVNSLVLTCRVDATRDQWGQLVETTVDRLKAIHCTCSLCSTQCRSRRGSKGTGAVCVFGRREVPCCQHNVVKHLTPLWVGVLLRLLENKTNLLCYLLLHPISTTANRGLIELLIKIAEQTFLSPRWNTTLSPKLSTFFIP